MISIEQKGSTRNALEGLDLQLSPGGQIIYRRTRRPASTCNLLAALAGLSVGEDRSR